MANYVFIRILNMSLTGAFVISAICLSRVLLRKGPKALLFFLWIVVGFRMLFPFSIESTFSLMPFGGQLIPPDIIAPQALYTGAALHNSHPLHMWITIGSYVWIAGVVIMLTYDMVSYIILRRKLADATYISDNIYEAKNIQTPFVLGLFSPKIYLPAHLQNQERQYVVLHEQMHIQRYDHIAKLIAYLILCLHWFNPLAWLAFLLINRDIEMACDEGVLKVLGGGVNVKKGYSSVLLSLMDKECITSRSSLAFVSSDISSRVKNILSMKKHSVMIFAVSVALVAVLSVGLSVNRISTHGADDNTHGETVMPEFFSDWCCD